MNFRLRLQRNSDLFNAFTINCAHFIVMTFTIATQSFEFHCKNDFGVYDSGIQGKKSYTMKGLFL